MANLLTNIQKAPFLYLSDHPNQNFENLKNLLDDGYKNISACDVSNSLKSVFFSARNTDIIQRWIIKEVYYKSKLKISYQNPLILNQLMNSIFVEYAQFLPFSLKEQIFELNSKVVNTCIPTIINNTMAQLYLIRDQEMLRPLPNPEYINSKGSRSSSFIS